MEYKPWIEGLKSTLPATDITTIEKAFQIASEAHAGQKRVSGEPFITHSLAVGQLLSEFGLDGETITAGLLHDVPEDTCVTIEELSQDFGPIIAKLVDGVTKMTEAEGFEHRRNPFNTQNRKEYQRAESLRKMFLAMENDVRVVMIKLIDRLHNMRTLNSMPDHKRQRISQETLDIFAPLANRLGIFQIKWELEDLSFRYLHPNTYNEIARKLDLHRPTMDRYISRVADRLAALLEVSGIKDAKLSRRTKHIYSIYRKMQRKEVDVEDIYDLMALRVIVKDVKDCYATLGVVHSLWRPIPGEFDDYIAAPKENGYQSLHTAVIDSDGGQFEVQIRTEEMHNSAELGIAAHWRYKDGTQKDLALDQKITAMRQAIKWQEDVIDASEFMDAIKSDVIEERVYIFTPNGDIIDLPEGSTPIDFAYHIHTEVGNKCRGAKVNGKLVNLGYKLKNGDKVEILTANRGGPSRDWLNENLGYVKTSRARGKIKYWFKRQKYQDSIAQGRAILEKELKRLGITPIKTDDLAKECGYAKTESFLAAIGYNDIPIKQIINKALILVPQEAPTEEKLQITSPPAIAAPVTTDNIHVMGVGNLLTTLANCCHPVPGDPITGYVTRGRGITVHRADCRNALRITDRERVIEVEWGIEEKTYAVDILILAFDRPGLVRDVTEIIANAQVNINNIDVITRRKNNQAEILLTLEIPSVEDLLTLMDKIQQLPNVIKIRRKG